MKYQLFGLAACAAAAAGWAALAGPGPDGDKLVIEGVEIVTEVKTQMATRWMSCIPAGAFVPMKLRP